MANSKYQYVRDFEKSSEQYLLPNTFIMIRVDGRGFHKFTDRHNFHKPNDLRALNLMNAAAKAVFTEISDIILAYGVSDEFSFLFRPECDLFERRASKLITTITSTFTAYYIFFWKDYFPNMLLEPPLPSFDGRVVAYPSDKNVKDYVAWRQVDCHINNLYNTTFWALIKQAGMTHVEAERELQCTIAADKNEILFSRFGINYNNEPEICKKGSVIYRELVTPNSMPLNISEKGFSKTQQQIISKRMRKANVVTKHIDIIQNIFWDERPWLLSIKS